ncbi:MAG: HAD hydrolase family protein [Bacteroidetes bacterium]|nr:HAD hydrolase family protein [Bacteroidota bacterium]
MKMNFKEKLKAVTTFMFDVDGVLTNGMLLVMPDGEFLRSMNIKDGYAMQLAIKKGYRIAIISGGHSKGVPVRLERLGVQDIFMGVTNKMQVYTDLLSKYNLTNDAVLYMGDDLPDLPLLQLCGVPCCPGDAVTEIKNQSIYISQKNGGDGCVRDIIEQVMRLHGTWE